MSPRVCYRQGALPRMSHGLQKLSTYIQRIISSRSVKRISCRRHAERFLVCLGSPWDLETHGVTVSTLFFNFAFFF